METDVPNAEIPAPGDTGNEADQSLLQQEVPTEGATDGAAETEDVTTGGDDKPLLTPGVDENGKSELAGAPESYEDFTLPEGFGFTDEMKSQVHGLFRDLDLSQKGGQKLIDAYVERVTAQKESELEALSARRRQWRAEVRKSPTFATDRAFAIKGMNAVVNTPEERALFSDSWMSDHPALFSMFVKVGKLVGEDTPLPKGGVGDVESSAVDRFPIKM